MAKLDQLSQPMTIFKVIRHESCFEIAISSSFPLSSGDDAIQPREVFMIPFVAEIFRNRLQAIVINWEIQTGKDSAEHINAPSCQGV